MSRKRNAFLIRLVTAVTLVVSLLGPLVTTPQAALAAGSAGSLTIVKATNPNPDPFDQSFSFSVSKSNETIPNFSLKNGQSQTIDLNASNSSSSSNRRYVVTETSTTGWTVDSISCSPSSPGNNWTVSTSLSNRSVTITPPQSNSPTKKDITCTFTNKTNYVGTLTLAKVTDPSPDATNQGFGFNVTRGGSAVSGGSFTLQNTQTKVFPIDNSGSNQSARTYVATESATAGWTLTDVACGAAPNGWTITPDKTNRKVTIVPPSGSTTFQNITCTFTNTQSGPPPEAGLTPLTVSKDLMPGESFDVTKYVQTPAGPPKKLDVLFLVDTTGSMQPSIDNVKTNATNIMDAVRAQVADSQFAVAGYRDDYDTQSPPTNYYFAVLQTMTSDTSAAQAGINLLAARSNGKDVPEGWINALWQVASKTGSGAANLDAQFRTDPDVTRVVILIGDSSGWDPSPRTDRTQGQGSNLTYWGGQHTEAQDITALQAANIKVMSLNVVNPQSANGLDSAGQATRISNATGGQYLGTANADVVADAIIDGLTNLPVNVKLVVDTCDNPPLSVTFNPSSVTVQPGEQATFTETVTVADPAAAGTYHCRVKATVDGQDLKDKDGNVIYEQITINVGARTGTIKIVKDAVPDSSQSFGFTGSGAIGSFSLTDDGANPNFKEFTVAAGSYTVTETGVTGWDLTGLTCDDPSGGTSTDLGSGKATIDLAAGESVTCTYTNTQRGKIITKKVTDPASTSNFTFNPSWGNSFTLQNGQQNDSGWLTPGSYNVTETVPPGWDLSSVSCTVENANGGTQTVDASKKAIIDLKPGETVTCTFTNTARKDLTVSKTATATFDRAYEWSIAKSIDESSSTVTIGPDGTATFNYNVAVNQTGYTDSNWKITGKITVNNPNTFDVTGVTVTDSFEGTTCAVTGGTNATVPANGHIELDYTCAPASQPAYTGKQNTATASWNSSWQLPSTSATGSADVTFNLASTTNATVTVKDNKVTLATPETLGTLDAANAEPWTSHTYEYSLTFDGEDGKCTDYSNSAWLDGTDWQSGKTVTVCVDAGATVSKDVHASYTTTYTWSITKDVDKTRVEIAPGGDANFHYTVKATHNDGVNSLWKVTGTISVTNNNQFGDMTNVAVSDDILDDTGDSCSIAAGGATTIAAGQTKTYTYTCAWTGTPANTTSQTNRATVTWAGGKSATYDATVDWSAATVTTVDASATVSDSLKGSLGTATVGVGANPTVFEYDQSHAGATGACTDYNNTATFTTADGQKTGSASKSVTVCVGANLTAEKTAAGSYDREYTWKIEKTATKDRIENASGSAAFEYNVTVTQTGVTDSGYGVSGTITVKNPNLWQDVTVDITDAIGPSWTCTVNDGTGVVVPQATDSTTPGTATVSYSCAWEGTDSPAYTGTNTATVTWDKDAAHTTDSSASGTASFTLSGTTTGAKNKTVTVTDPLASPTTLGTVTANDPPAAAASKTFIYTHTFTDDPVGTCTPHENTATITETEQTASKTVTHCVGADLTVSKTANPTFDRTYKWKVDKSVDGPASQTISGGSATFNYIVDVTTDGYTDSNWQITGTITVSNPNDWQAITAVVTDAYEGVSCTVVGGAVTVPAASGGTPGTATATYTCTFETAPKYDGTNTATVQWNNATYHTPTDTATGTKSVSFSTPTNETNRTVDVYDSAKTTKLGTSDYVAGPFQYTYQLDWQGTPGQCTTHDNTATLKSGETTLGSDTQTVEVCTTEKLGVSKTASPALTRTYAWDIAKTVDKDSQTIPLGGSATFNYTVSVTHDAGTDSLWKVTGTITVTNPNQFSAVTGVSVSDAIDDANATCTVTGGSDTIAASGSATFDYECTYSAAPAAAAQTNTATVTWTSLGAGATSASYELPFNWTSPAVTRVNDSVNVTDTQAGDLGAVSYTDASPKELTYSKEFTPTAAGCTTYDNTATFTAKDDSTVTDSADKSVQVCTGVDLTVTKTANPAYHRTVTWAIVKDVDQSSVTIAAGGTATSHYTVGVTKTVTQSAWVVTGTITVSNPNGWAIDATIGDTIDNGGSCSITSAGGATVTVPAAGQSGPGTASVTYSCAFTSNPGTGTNTATATWNADTAHTPTGTASGTADYDFAEAQTTTTGLDTITVIDTKQPGTKTFPASGTWDYSVDRAGVAGACTDYDNTAKIVETNQTADASVTVCVGADLTVTKSASGSFQREYLWDISKSVNTTSQNVPAGTDATFNYGVTATQTGVKDSGWKVAGTITVHNPNWQAVTVDVTDAIGTGWSCTVTGGTSVSVGAGQTVSLGYTCDWTGTDAPASYNGTNTATATWDATAAHTPTGSASGTADYTLNQTGSTNKTVDVYDNKVSLASSAKLGTLTATDGTPWASQTFSYTLGLAGVSGVCTDYTNTATLKSGETTLDSASQTVEVCGAADLTVAKTASGSFDREYTWDISKTVNTDSQSVPAGTNATFSYGVTATQTGIVDSNWKVTGKITVSNPNAWQSIVANVTDSIDNGGSCTMSIGGVATDGKDIEIAKSGSVVIDYSCTYASKPASYSGTNTATATWNKETAHTTNGSASGTASFTLSQVGSTNKTVDVYDDKTNPASPVKLGTLTAVDQAPFTTQTWTYTLDLTGNSGVCTDYTNNAWLKVGETKIDTTSQTVEVCGAADLTVSKTANTAFVRTYTWDITKAANPTALDLFAGDSGSVGYTVAVDKTTTDSAWVVSGEITVSNPNVFMAVVVDVTDSIPNGGVCTVPGGTQVTVPAATDATHPGTKTLAYTCAYAKEPKPYSDTNTATATWDKETAHTANGSASGTATADFSKATITTVGNDSVNVDDTNGESWGPVSEDATWQYTEAMRCSADQADYTDGHYQYTHRNTATINETGDDSQAVVVVNCYAPVVSSAGVAEYTRTWDWDITKTADVSALQLGFWQSGTVTYQVSITATPNDSDLTVNGTLTIKNPNPSAPMTAAVAGMVNGVAATFTSDADCAITNGSVTIPAGGTATCAYTAPLGTDFPQAGSATAAATVTVGGVVFGTATTITIGDPTTIVDESVQVTDSQVGALGTVSAGADASSASKSWTYTKQIGPYAACTVVTIDNTATFVTNDTATTGSDDWTVQVTVNCDAQCDCTQIPSWWLSLSNKNSRDRIKGYHPAWDLVGAKGADTTFFKSPYSYRTALLLTPRGNDTTYYTLAQQYIAAELNLLQGATAPQEVVDAMYRAKVLFETYTPAQVATMSPSQKAEFTSLTTTLYRYNFGIIGPGRCR